MDKAKVGRMSSLYSVWMRRMGEGRVCLRTAIE